MKFVPPKVSYDIEVWPSHQQANSSEVKKFVESLKIGASFEWNNRKLSTLMHWANHLGNTFITRSLRADDPAMVRCWYVKKEARPLKKIVHTLATKDEAKEDKLLAKKRKRR